MINKSKMLLSVFMTSNVILSFLPEFALAEEGKTESLEVIVITGQKRAENMQDVSVAATSVSGDDLDGKGVQRLDDLQFISPSVSITDFGLTQNVNIRGVGIASGSPAAGNGVATYIDGVFQPPIVTTNSFYDIAAVEVFRGPQGTFVGSNATGGAIFITSQNPNLDELGGYAEANIGNYSAYGLEGALNLPVTDIFAVRGAFNYRKRDSFYTDVGPLDSKAGRLDEISGRVGALLEPNDQFQALLKVEFNDKETGGYAYQPANGTPYVGFRPADIRTLDYDSPTENNENNVQSILELKYQLANGVSLRGIGGYQNKRISNLYDLDATNAANYGGLAGILSVATEDQFVRERVWTGEVNVISPTDGDFSWIFGGYFQKNKILVDITFGDNGFPTDLDITDSKTTTGYFAQATYQFTPEISVDVGGRYSHFSVTQTGLVAIGRDIPGFPPAGLPVADLGGEHGDGRFTGKVALNWKPSEQDLLYAFVTRGYKSGGVIAGELEFRPETVIDYEIGWKRSFADDRIRTQISAFYYDYKDFQFDILDLPSGQLNPLNVADAKSKGIEAQVQAKFGGFGFDAGIAYLDTSLGNFSFANTKLFSQAFPGQPTLPQCAAGQVIGCVDYTPFIRDTNGGPLPYAPRWTYNLGAEYAFDVQDFVITPRLNYAFVDKQFTYIGYSPVTDQLQSHGLLTAQVTFEMAQFELSVYARNLADKDYVSGQSDNNQFYGAPREYGARVRMSF